MNDQEITGIPIMLEAIRRDTDDLGFRLASEPKTGSLLRALAASKPGGEFLELGTGTGMGTAWLLAGMDASARLTSVESDPNFVDDLLPQPSWPEGHAPRVPALIVELEKRRGFVAAKLAWASGLMLLVRTSSV